MRIGAIFKASKRFGQVLLFNDVGHGFFIVAAHRGGRFGGVVG